MKLIITCTIFLLFAFYANAQTITGKVYREGTDSVIVGASVYYGGSTTGTITDSYGRFTLSAKSQQIPITISCIGYNSDKVNYKPGEVLIIYLKPKSNELREVNIMTDGMKRRDEEAAFIREFIGTSANALGCIITNIKDIYLFYNRKTHTLSASSDNPVNIENKRLGYTITYYLDSFENTPKEVKFSGNFIFKDNINPTDKNWEKIQKNRELAYEDSRMQFVRALWNRTLSKTNFQIYTPYYERLNEDSIIVEDSLKQKYVHLNSRLLIINAKNIKKINPLIQKEKLCYISKEGFYNAGLLWTGDLAIQRIGDLLPFEYQSKTELIRNAMPDHREITPVIMDDSPEKAADKLPRNKTFTEMERNAEIFKNIVLTTDNPLNNQLVVKRWQEPVYYKIYGTCGNTAYDLTLAQNIKGLFDSLSVCTGLPMTAATIDKTPNFIILIGKLPGFKDIVNRETYQFFVKEYSKAKTSSDFKKATGYYTCSENGFVSMAQLIDMNSTGRNKLIWCQIKIQIMNGLGFFGQILANNNSLFYAGLNAWEPKDGIQPFDRYIIKSLYNPNVLTGTTKQQLDLLMQPKGSN